jgi:DNA-binding transcriptional LysR family regulator
MIEIRHIRAFVAVAEELHFGRAARRLHMSQPPLSQTVRQLEEQVGALLLNRTTRSVSLTPAGRAFLARVRSIPQAIEVAEQDARRAAEDGPARLAVGFTASTAHEFLPVMIRAFRAVHPDVELHMREMTSVPQLADLRSGALDVALLRPPLAGAELTWRVVQREELVVALPREHALAGRRAVRLRDLDGEPFVAFPEDASPYFAQLVGSLLRSRGVRPRIAQQAVMPTLLSFVVAGVGLALVPASAQRLAVRSLTFRPISDDTGDHRVELAAAWRTDDPSPLIVSWRRVVEGVNASREAPPLHS